MLSRCAGCGLKGFTRRQHSYLPLLSFRSCIGSRAMATSNDSLSLKNHSTSGSSIRVGTHNGSFHCDEALGCFMLRLTSKFSGAEIVRSRDPQILAEMDAVLDVGGEYDPKRYRFDHHQKGFDEVFGNGFVTKLSSAGLVYKHFGKEIIAKELEVEEDHPDVHRLYLAIYRSFVEAVDANDNGINQFDSDKPPRYVNNTHLPARIGRLNLDWTDPDQSSENENAAFQRAMALAGNEFVESVRFHVRSWLPARSIVMNCINRRFEVDLGGEIMVLNQFCPVSTRSIAIDSMTRVVLEQWKLHLFELEEEMKVEPKVKYVLYGDERSKGWRLQAVSVSPDKFESRKALPEDWRGLRDDDLSNKCGVSGCVFVHSSGFIGGNKTYQGALAMAIAALAS